MSKDKYRPSITDQEVVKTRPDEDRVISTSTTGSSGGGGVEGGIEVEEPTGPSNRTAPTGLRVLKETIYYSPEGQQLVEVTFGWDDVAGATEYELRVARG